jgi:hypothetical protein
MTDTRTLDSKVGRFIFFKETPLSHAKLIRDAVMNQVLQPNYKKIKTGADAVNYIRNNCAGSYSDTVFSFYPNPRK